jgi:CubicO group peptidase (beta-lactamase class C family)
MIDRIDDLFAKWDRKDSPGCVLGVVRDGELVHEGYYGMADLEHGIPHSADSVFDIASSSKQFTAAAILLLHRAGQLDLDDVVQEYIPELPGYEAPITLRHLVHHTSGLRDYIALRHLAGVRDGDHFDMQDVIDLLARQQGLNFPPGTEHRYSNSGYVLLAHVVSRVTGESFDAWCVQHIFEPLGMSTSTFREDVRTIVPGLVQSYTRRPDGRLHKTVENEDIVGDGGLLTTVGDLARWERNYLDETVGGPGFTAAMSTPGTPEGSDERYAFGLSVGDYRGRTTVSHGGNLHGYSGEFLRFPDERLAIICLANLGAFDASGLARQVADVVLGLDLPPTSQSRPASAAHVDASRFAGHYRHEESGMLIEVAERDHGLVAALSDQVLTLTPTGTGTFTAEYNDVLLDVTIDDASLCFLHNGETLLSATRIEVATPSDLDRYAGRYHSDELDLDATIIRSDGELYFHRGRATRERLQPTLPEHFALPFGGIEFTGPDEFKLSMSRTSGVRFRRSPGQP